jgi:nitroreductase
MSGHNEQSIVDGRSYGQLGPVARAFVEAAVRAPSVHNSQPWRFGVHRSWIDVLADRSRQLAVIDPCGRELLISVGAAVLNLRVAILGHGRVPILRLFPDPSSPDLVARVILGPVTAPDPTAHALLANRRPFTAAAVPASVMDELVAAAAAEGATLAIADPVGRDAILGLAATAEDWQRAEAGYRDELTSWTVPPYGRSDGVPAHAFGPHDRYESVPLRDFGLTQPQVPRGEAAFEAHPSVLVLRTAADGPRDWVRAGQAMQRVLLTATVRGVATTPMTQALEVPEIRRLLTDPDRHRYPQLILRVGYGRPVVASPRRPLAEVLVPGGLAVAAPPIMPG